MKRQPPRSLAESIERLGARIEQFSAFLEGKAVSRVANAPENNLEDAAERARKYWNKLEGIPSTVPPPPLPKAGVGR